jgi:hypothetical protein
MDKPLVCVRIVIMTSIMQKIKEQVNEVLVYSQCLDKTEGVDTLINEWFVAKKRFIDRWNGELIVNAGPVEFELSQDEKDKRLSEFIDTVEYQYDNTALSEFIDSTRKDFFDNQLSQEYYDDWRNIRVPKGMKIVKAFKLFETNETLLRELQDQASMIIQENSVKGNLFLSVHPLDYLSSSENTYHWRSCHALDGEYRAGNLSYMLDSSTIICYLADPDKQVKLPRFPVSVPWNSKKWRMLLHVEDEFEGLMAGRQYPFFSKHALNVIQLKFLGGNTSIYWSPWYDDYITDFPRKSHSFGGDNLVDRHICIKGRIYSMGELVTDAHGSKHYSDLKYSSFYTPYYCWTNYPKKVKRRQHYSIGKSALCVRCGNLAIDQSEYMLCDICADSDSEDDYFCCDCCGSRTPREEAYQLSGTGNWICEKCYVPATRTCDCCGLKYFSEDVEYSNELEKWRCRWCRSSEVIY